MTIMARTLGIPARVAVGFLPGEAGRRRQVRRDRPPVPRVARAVLRGLRLGAVRADARRPDRPAARVERPVRRRQRARPHARTRAFPGATRCLDRAGRRRHAADVARQRRTRAARGCPSGSRSAVVLVVASLALVLVRRRASLLPDLTPERAWSTRPTTSGQAGRRVVGLRHAPHGRRVGQRPGARTRTGSELHGEAADASVALARTVEAERYAREQPGRSTPTVLARWVDELVRRSRAAAQRPPSPRRRSQRSSRRLMKSGTLRLLLRRASPHRRSGRRLAGRSGDRPNVGGRRTRTPPRRT